MSTPLVVNTKDGTCWTRRTVTSGGIALYAPEKIRTSPEFVMATEAELAEHGIVGSADALPMPVSPEPQPRTMLDRARDALNARMAKDDLRLVLENVIGYAAWLEAERHSTNESLSEAAEQLRADRDRITELETLAGQATEFRLWEPGYGLYIRRAPGAAGFGVLEARRTDKGRRCWTTAGWQYSAVLTDTELFCWPDAQTAVAEARRVMPGAEACEPLPYKAQPLTVYRASHDSIVMGLYTTAAAAREHCKALVRREYMSSGIADLKLSWREDEDTVDQPEDGEQELIEHVGPHFARPTGYVVTPLEVAAAYDEEADE